MSSSPSGSDTGSEHLLEQLLEERRQAAELRAEAAELRAAAAELRAAAAAPIISRALVPPWYEVGLTLAAILLDVLLLAATFVIGRTLAPLVILYSSWRCSDLLKSPQRQWRSVMAVAMAVACVATVSQAVGVACCTVCGLLLLTRAAFIIKLTLV